MDQTNKFKPANHGEAAQSIPNEDKLMKGLENILGSTFSSSDLTAPMLKCRSFGPNSSQINTRGIKNSIKDEAGMVSGRKSAEMPNSLTIDEDILNNNGTNSSGSLTTCTREEQANKLKSEEKSNQKSSLLKNKDEQSPIESSDKSSKSEKDYSKEKTSLAKLKEKVCLQWIKELAKMETEKKNLPAHVQSDDMPKYCSNKICPISEQKIVKNPKVQASIKKVVLRKVPIEDQEER